MYLLFREFLASGPDYHNRNRSFSGVRCHNLEVPAKILTPLCPARCAANGGVDYINDLGVKVNANISPGPDFHQPGVNQ